MSLDIPFQAGCMDCALVTPTIPRSLRPPAGFTLIELLVVITVVMVMIALLLPALASARGAAQLTSCMTKLKHIHTANIAYAADFRAVPSARYFETQSTSGSPTMNDFWHRSQLRDFARGPAMITSTMRGGYLPANKSVAWCPSKNPLEPGTSGNMFWDEALTVDSKNWGIATSVYAVNSVFNARWNFNEQDQYRTGGAIPLPKWDKYPKAFYATEVVAGFMVSSANSVDPGSLSRPARHKGSVNVLFPPGHVVSRDANVVRELISTQDDEFLRGD